MWHFGETIEKLKNRIWVESCSFIFRWIELEKLFQKICGSPDFETGCNFSCHMWHFLPHVAGENGWLRTDGFYL